MDFTKIEAEVKALAQQDSRSGIDEYSGDENLSYAQASTTHQQQEDILWITLKLRTSWDNTSPWDDYSGYDDEETLYNWIGLVSTLSDVESIAQLNQWAKHTYFYKARVVKSDARYDCSHEGTRVKSVVGSTISVEDATKADTEWIEERRGVYPKYFFSDTREITFQHQGKG